MVELPDFRLLKVEKFYSNGELETATAEYLESVTVGEDTYSADYPAKPDPVSGAIMAAFKSITASQLAQQLPDLPLYKIDELIAKIGLYEKYPAKVVLTESEITVKAIIDAIVGTIPQPEV